MQDLPALREWIDEHVLKYYRQLGITKVSIPTILYGLQDAPKDVLANPTAKRYKRYAAVSLFHPTKPSKPSWIVLNLDWHKSLNELEDTIAHEMIHMRFPDMECSGSEQYKFFKMLGMVLMGKSYKKELKKKRTR